MYLLILAALGGGVCVPSVQQKVIVEPAAAQTIVQTDQFGGQRIVVQTPAHHAHLAPQAFYTQHHDAGATAQQNAALLQLAAKAQADQQANIQALLQLSANQQAFSQQLIAAGVVTGTAGVNIQSFRVPVPTHPGRALFEQRCLSCHGAENPSGGLDLSTLSDDLICASVTAILDGSMPKGGTLSDDERRQLGAYLKHERLRLRGAK